MGRQYFLRKRLCPACNEFAAVPVLYGAPDPELYQAVERGELVMSQDIPGPGSPEWVCRRCGYRWVDGKGS